MTDAAFTGMPAIRRLLRNLGEADVVERLKAIGIDANEPCKDRALFGRLATAVAPLVKPQERRTLGDLLPNLSKLGDESLSTDQLKTRSSNCLGSAGIRTVDALTRQSPASLMRLPSAGATTLQDIVQLAIRLHMQFDGRVDDRSSDVRVERPSPDRAQQVDDHSACSATECFASLGPDAVETALSTAGLDPRRRMSDEDLDAIVSALRGLVLNQSNRPLEKLLPGLALTADTRLSTAELPRRAVNVLTRHNVFTRGDLGELSMCVIRQWDGCGEVCLEEYADLAMREHRAAMIDASPASLRDSTSSPLAATSEALAKIAEWAASASDHIVIGDLLSPRIEMSLLPIEIATAMQSLVEMPVAPWRVSPERLADCLHAVWSVLDDRERDIFASRRLVADPPTLESIGLRHDLGKVRVHELETQACKRLRARLEEPAQAPLRWRLLELRRRIGNGMPERHPSLAAAIDRATDGFSPDETDLALMLWLAGPYCRREGWVILEHQQLPNLPLDDPRFECGMDVDSADVASWLEEAGFRRELAADFMASCRQLRTIEGRWRRWDILHADKAHAILSSIGRPMGISDLVARFQEPVSREVLRRRMMSDTRFTRVKRDTFALRSWKLPELRSIGRMIVDRIERNGGSAFVDAIVDELVTTFDVSESSVRQRMLAPRFIITDGSVRLRPEESPWQSNRNIDKAGGLFPDPRRGLVHLLVRVDAELERGSGRQLHPATATLLGVVPGSQREFAVGESLRVNVSWPVLSNVPLLGSTRLLAAAIGASDGHSMLLSFDLAASTVAFRRLDSNERGIAMLTGIETSQGRELETLAESLDCDADEVIDVLTARGDERIAELLAAECSDHPADAEPADQGPVELG